MGYLTFFSLSVITSYSIHYTKLYEMAASLVKHGQLTAVVAVEQGGCHILIDGFKRHRCAGKLGMKTLKVAVLKKSGAEAKALLYLLSRPDGFSTIMEALVVITSYSIHYTKLYE